MSLTLSLTCYGGVGSVTGANFLLEGIPGKFLIDCGLVQGTQFCEEENYAPFAYDVASIDALFITHAHLDHIGRIPKLVKDGFRGPIYSTPETAEISALMFDDALSVMEYDMARGGPKPLYSKDDIEEAKRLWKTLSYHTELSLGNGLTVYFKDAGHVLGSVMIEFRYGARKMVCTGDLGNSPSLLLNDTEVVADADYLLMESVYGDKNHESKEERDKQFAEIVRSTIASGGALVIPAFSLERTQNILYSLNGLVERGEVPSVPVFVDSPLASRVTEIYERELSDFKQKVQKEIKAGDDVFAFPKLKFTLSSQESDAIERTPNPKIILAGSGMSAGGRVTKHEKKFLPDPKSTILLVGYQSLGTLGRQLENKQKEVIIDGEHVVARARILSLRGFSSHKDSDGLVNFVADTAKTVKKVFVAMGEPKASLFLVQRLRDSLGVDALYPERGKKYPLEF